MRACHTLHTLAFAAAVGLAGAIVGSASSPAAAYADAPSIHHVVVSMPGSAPITVESMEETQVRAVDPHEDPSQKRAVERPSVTFVYVAIANDPFLAWRNQVASGRAQKRDVRAVGVDANGKAIFTYVYRGALPDEYARSVVKVGDATAPRARTTLSFDTAARSK